MTDSESLLIRSAIDSQIAATVKQIPTRRRKTRVKIKANKEGKKGRKRKQRRGKNMKK